MGKIIKLDEQLSNKIAAGEVVERPASIVKELVENAIDAKSTRIQVDVEEGGLSKIRVLDNGDGIEAEDCQTAFYRHATSKIKTDQDLFRIETLGFRGEALPSIASVSHLEMKSSTGEGPGTHLVFEGGKLLAEKSTTSRKGTEFLVSNLFFNTPARLKYMKTVHTELGNISDVINRQALSHPAISFRLTHNGKEMLHTNGGGDLLQVIAAIYGRSIAKKMLPIQMRSIDYTVTGYVAKPEVTRASRQYISTFINGRYIKNYPLARAIHAGYHTLLPIGRHPLVVLTIEMDPLLIDVNVHPAKLEVRLSKEDELTKVVEEGIKDVFKSIQLIPEVKQQRAERAERVISEQMNLDFLPPKHEEVTKSESRVYENRSDRNSGQAINQLYETEQSDGTKASQGDEGEDRVVTQTTRSTPTEANIAQQDEPDERLITEKTQKAETVERVPVLYPIGQLHGTYILAQNETGLFIIDQHAAQERIKYEYYREKVGETTAELQELLIPFTLEFTQAETVLIEEQIERLKTVGVFIERFGSHTFMVRSHPTWFPKGYEQETIKELIEQLLQQRQVDIKKFREESAILMSCKASIKANRHLRSDEMFALLQSLRKSSDPFTCPHGRPIIVHLTTYEMEKMFKRVM